MPDVSRVLDLLPDGASIDDGALVVGGKRATELAETFGTPLVVYDEATIRNQARAYRAAAPDALVAYGTKAFPTVAVLRLFAEEGLGADVSTRASSLRPTRGARRSAARRARQQQAEDELLRGAAEAGALVVLDSLDELERAQAAGVERLLIRVTPGIEADTHEAMKTAHHGSKFGLPPDDAVELLRRIADCEGLHVHVGSQLMHFGASLMTVDWVAQFVARLRAELDWVPRLVDLGGGLGVRHVLEEPSFSIEEFVGGLVGELAEPGSCSNSRAATDTRARAVAGLPCRHHAVHRGRREARQRGDDVRRRRRRDVRQPAAAMYNARYTALLAARADAAPTAPSPSRASTASPAMC